MSKLIRAVANATSGCDADSFENGFNYAMSLVDSHSTHEYLSSRMTEDTYKFIQWLIRIGELEMKNE